MNVLKYNKGYQDQIAEIKKRNKEQRKQVLEMMRNNNYTIDKNGTPQFKKQSTKETIEDAVTEEKVDEVFVPSVFNSIDDDIKYNAEAETANNIVIETTCTEKE